MYRKIHTCRICGNPELVHVLDLGEQSLTGVFPRSAAEAVPAGPLRLVKCHGSDATCGLLQLQHTYDLSALYGDNYGYRSGLNRSMVEHLHGKVRRILDRFTPRPGAMVIDIGSNDGTTLKAYPEGLFTLVGVDPTGNKFRGFYPPHIRLISDFFSPALVRAELGNHRAAVVTSFSMFYDLEDPLEFMRGIASVLDDEGVWIFEQSYMPTMLACNSYDTVCHEHLEYYGLRQIQWMADRADLKIVDVEFNDINGGSFSVVAARKRSGHEPTQNVAESLRTEAALMLDSLQPYRDFADRTLQSRNELQMFIKSARRAGKSVGALGASTKGNVILQYCGMTSADISLIGEVNEDKYGCYTPGTRIPIVPESEVLKSRPDLLLVLPWHFRSFFEQDPRFDNQTLVFPLPSLDLRVRRGD